MLKQAPASIRQKVKSEVTEKGLIRQDTDPSNGFKKVLPTLDGFIAIYSGYVCYSKKGQITFPVRHDQQKIYLVVTPKIELPPVFGNTVSHKKFAKGVEADIYLLEKKENGDGTFFWKVSKEKKPANNEIKNLSIVILTDKSNIILPTGDFMTSKGPNLVLPSPFVVGNKGNKEATNDFIDKARHFEKVKEEEQSEKTTAQRVITNN